MIKLENVSALHLLKQFRGEKEERFLKENKILNYQDLKDCLNDDNYSKYLNLYLELLKTESRICKFNMKGKEPILYETSGYSISKLVKNDKKVYGSDLLLWNPTSELWIDYASLKSLNLFEIKHLLSHVDSKGDNSLCNLRGISNFKASKVYDAVVMYEEQILRQYEDTKLKCDDLFYLNQELKKKLVMDSLRDIVLYLIDNTEEELVWGKLTDAQKNCLVSCVINDKHIDRVVKAHLCNVIANYTTLSELESGVVKGKTLNRFIKK